MKGVYKCILLFIITCFVSCIATFSGTYGDFSNFTIEDGLSNNKINCIFQDKNGYLWIGTADGLNRFDGYGFIVYRSFYGDTITISNNFITSIDEDEFGNLWIGTYYGLNKLNKKAKTFTRYYHQLTEANTLSSNVIHDIFCDKKSGVWIKTENSLDYFNINEEIITNFFFYNNYFNVVSNTKLSGLLKDTKNRLWVGTKDGFNYYDSQLEQFERFQSITRISKSLSNNTITDIYEDYAGNIWIGTLNGLNLFNAEEKSFNRYYIFPSSDLNKRNTINEIYQDSKEYLWLGTQNGIYIFNKLFNSFTPLNQYLNIKYDIGFNNSPVLSIMKDNSDIIWIGTEDKGLFKYDKKGKKFKTYNLNLSNFKLFGNNNISSIYHDKKNNLWIGTRGYGLYILNRKNFAIRNLSDVNNFNISNNNINALKQLSNGKVLAGTHNGIIEISKDFRVKKYLREYDKVFENNAVYAIHETQQNGLWFCTSYGLHRFKDDKLTSYYSNLNDSFNLPSNIVYCITEDNLGNLWIGTSNGLCTYDIASNKILRYNINKKSTEHLWLVGKDVYSLYFSSRNQLWIGTAEGLIKYTTKRNEFKILTEYDGLPNNMIYSILEDTNGNLWISTNKGISLYKPESNQFLNFDIADGLQGYEFNLGSSFKHPSGELFFGGKQGVNYFHPDSITFNNFIPNIVISSFELYDKQGIKKILIEEGDTVYISLENNHFTIEFSVLDFTIPHKCNYAYKLEGIENDWIYIGNNRKATFSNIPSGEYYFRVKGSNNDNIWNDEGTYIYLIVETPFWKSNFVYVIYGLIFIAFIFLVIQLRTKSLRNSNKILKERELTSYKLEIQREELMLKNKSITDSINYAKRIQEAIMPSEKYFKSILPSSFILYTPKDIVSGDFYWIAENNNKIFIAVVDCTGHGVPGAFMSIIGFELLRNITLIQKIEDPSIVLNKLNVGVAQTFNAETGDLSVKDGMDLAFCAINKKTRVLEFAGAFNPLYLVRDNKIVEIKADRYTVGTIKEEEKSFSKHIVPLDGLDMLYLFTDGYTDQFGGPQEKKFKYRRFRHLLLTIHKLSMAKQKLFLKESIEKWKGDLEQVDDILVMGINPKDL